MYKVVLRPFPALHLATQKRGSVLLVTRYSSRWEGRGRFPGDTVFSRLTNRHLTWEQSLHLAPLRRGEVGRRPGEGSSVFTRHTSPEPGELRPAHRLNTFCGARTSMMVYRKCPLLLAIVLLCGCGVKPPLPDREQIVGAWVVVDFISPAAVEDRGQRRKKLIVTAGTWSQQFQGDRFEDFEYSLDPNKTPKEIDLTYTAPDARRLTTRAIYELSGNRLRLCLGSPPVVEKDGKVEFVESVRPTAFEAKLGVLITYCRVTE